MTTVEPNGLTTNYVYGLKNRVEKIITDPDGSGSLPALIKAYIYNCLGLVNEEIENAVYNSSGTLTSGIITGYAYDGLQRLVKTFLPRASDGKSHQDVSNAYLLNDDTALGATIEYVYDGLGRLVETKNTAPGAIIVSSNIDTKPTAYSNTYVYESTLSKARVIDLSQYITDAQDSSLALRFSIQSVSQSELFKSIQINGKNLTLFYNDNVATPESYPCVIKIQAHDTGGNQLTNAFNINVIRTEATPELISETAANAQIAEFDAGYGIYWLDTATGTIKYQIYNNDHSPRTDSGSSGEFTPASSSSQIVSFLVGGSADSVYNNGLSWVELRSEETSYYDESLEDYVTATEHYYDSYLMVSYLQVYHAPVLLYTSESNRGPASIVGINSSTPGLPENSINGVVYAVAVFQTDTDVSESSITIEVYNYDNSQVFSNQYSVSDYGTGSRSVGVTNDGNVVATWTSSDSTAVYYQQFKINGTAGHVHQVNLGSSDVLAGSAITTEGGMLIGYNDTSSSYVRKYAPDGTYISFPIAVDSGAILQLESLRDGSFVVQTTNGFFLYSSNSQYLVGQPYNTTASGTDSFKTFKLLSNGTIVTLDIDSNDGFTYKKIISAPEQTTTTEPLYVTSITPGKNVIGPVNEILVTFSGAADIWDDSSEPELPDASNFEIACKATPTDSSVPVTIASIQRVSKTQFILKLSANAERSGLFSVTVKATGALISLDQDRNNQVDGTAESRFGFYVTAPIKYAANVTTVSSHFTYDTFDRIKTSTDPNGLTTAYEYASALSSGLYWVSITSPGIDQGRKTTSYSDAAGRIVKIELPPIDDPAYSSSYPVTPTIQYQYDRNSNLTLMTDQLGRQTRYVNDHRDRLQYQIEANPNALDGDDGQSDGVIAPSWDGTTFESNAAPPTTAIYTQFWYDSANQLRLVQDTLGRQSYTEYDTLGRVIKEVAPSPTTGLAITTNLTNVIEFGAAAASIASGARETMTTYAFRFSGSNKIGDKITVTQPHPDNLNLTGPQTTYEYDLLGRITKAILPDPDYSGTNYVAPAINYTYNNKGQLETIRDPNGQYTGYTYNGRGEVTTARNQGAYSYTSSSDLITSYSYDLLGNLRSVTDALGRSTRYITDKGGRDYAMINPLGEVSTSLYDAAGRYAGSVDTAGRAAYMTFDNQDRVTNVYTPHATDPLAFIRSQTSTYDLVGNLVKTTTAAIQDPANSSGTITPEYVYRYDNWNRLTTAIRPNPITGLAEDGSHQAIGPKTEYNYDRGSQLIATRTWTDLDYSAAGLREQGYQYDKAGRLTTSIAPNPGTGKAWTNSSFTTVAGITTNYKYDALDRVVETTLPDPDGAASASTSARIGYEYDAAGRLIRSVQPSTTTGLVWNTNSSGAYTYTNGRRDLVSGASATDYIYDAAGRLTSTLDAGIIAVNPSTASGAPATIASRRWTIYAYDSYGRMTNSTLAALSVSSLNATTGTVVSQIPSQVTTYAFDKVGNQISVTTPEQRTTTTRYDALNRPVEQIDARDGRTNFAYDTAGNLTSITDPAGNTTRYEFDRRDRTVLDINALGKVRSFVYDDADRLTMRTDRNNNVRAFEYDALSNLTKEQWKTVADSTNILGEFDFAYNAIDEMLGASSGSSYADRPNSDSNLNWVYDHGGRVSRLSQDILSDWRYTQEFYYDDLNRRIVQQLTSAQRIAIPEETTQINVVFDFRNTYAYDARSRVTSIVQNTFPIDTEHFEYYTERFDDVETADINYVFRDVVSKRVDFTYNALDQWTGISRNSRVNSEEDGGTLSDPYYEVITTSYKHDALARTTQIKHTTPFTINSNPFSMSNGSLNTFDYSYDNVNRVTNKTSLDGTVNYTYDGVGQLVGANQTPISILSGALPDETYGYELNGNRWQKGTGTTVNTVTSGPTNQVLDDGEFTYTYDDEGNRVSKFRKEPISNAEDNYEFLKYDHRNRLVAVEYHATSADDSALLRSVSYGYDALDRRNYRVDSDDGVYERYVYDGWDVIADHRDEGTSGSGDAWHRYLWAPHERAGEASLLLAQDFVYAYFWDEDVNWMLADNLNSVIDVVGLAGDNTPNNPASVYRKEHIVYTSFGEVATAWSYLGYSQELTTTRYGYTSQEYDNVTGYQWNNLRVYDSNTATWLTNDPIEWEAGQTSFMMYAGNDPVNRTDPSGLLWGFLSGAIIGGISGLVGAYVGAAVRGRLPTRGEVTGAIVSGAMHGATIGSIATGDVAGAVLLGAGSGFVSSAAGSYVRQKIDNNGRVNGDEVLLDATVGGIAGGLFGGIGGPTARSGSAANSSQLFHNALAVNSRNAAALVRTACPPICKLGGEAVVKKAIPPIVATVYATTLQQQGNTASRAIQASQEYDDDESYAPTSSEASGSSTRMQGEELLEGGGFQTKRIRGLERPSLDAGTKATIEAPYKKNAAGELIDPKNGNVIIKPENGHLEGIENWRILQQAERLGLNQEQLNKFVNAHPQYFEKQAEKYNRSHKGELLGPDPKADSRILKDMEKFFGL